MNPWEANDPIVSQAPSARPWEANDPVVSQPPSAPKAPVEVAPGVFEAPIGDNEAKAMGATGEVDNAARMLAKGATFNMAPEIAAAGDATVGHFFGRGSQAADWAQRFKENADAERAKDKAYEEQSPVASKSLQIAGGVAPFLIPGVGPALASGGLQGQVVKGALTGAAASGLNAFGEAGGQDMSDRLVAAAKAAPLGGLIGGAAPAILQGVGKLVSPLASSALNPEETRLVQAAASEGIPLTTAQQSNSKALKTAESVLKELPFSGSMQKAQEEAANKAFNKAVMSRVGESADNAAPEVINSARTRLSKAFENLSSQTNVPINDKFLGELQAIHSEYAGSRLPSQVRGIVDNYINDILEVGNSMPGDKYQAIRSILSADAKNYAQSTDGASKAAGRALKAIRDALDNQARENMPEWLGKAWDVVRQQYGALKTVEQAMKSSTNTAISGNIQPTAFFNAVKQSNPYYFPAGQGELNDLARVGARFLRDPTPNSGTAQRAMMHGLLTGGAGIGALGGVMVNPLATAATTVGGLMLPPIAQYAMQSAPGRALLLNQAGPAMAKTLSPLAQAIAAPVEQQIGVRRGRIPSAP